MKTSPTFTADVVQFFRPDGRQELMQIDLDSKYQNSYSRMTANNQRLEAEVLTTGHVSLTISDSEEDLQIEIVGNGPDVIIALEKLLTDYPGPIPCQTS